MCISIALRYVCQGSTKLCFQRLPKQDIFDTDKPLPASKKEANRGVGVIGSLVSAKRQKKLTIYVVIFFSKPVKDTPIAVCQKPDFKIPVSPFLLTVTSTFLVFISFSMGPLVTFIKSVYRSLLLSENLLYGRASDISRFAFKNRVTTTIKRRQIGFSGGFSSRRAKYNGPHTSGCDHSNRRKSAFLRAKDKKYFLIFRVRCSGHACSVHCIVGKTLCITSHCHPVDKEWKLYRSTVWKLA